MRRWVTARTSLCSSGAKTYSISWPGTRAWPERDDPRHGVCLAVPPGVSKTAFLSALKRCAKTPEWGGPPMACVGVSAANLHRPVLVLAGIASQIPPQWKRPNEDVRTLLGRLTGASVSVGAEFTLSASASWSAREAEADPTMPWTQAAKTPKESGPPPGTVICLLIDEAHSLRPTSGEKINWLLHSPSIPCMRAPTSEGCALIPAFAVLTGHTHAKGPGAVHIQAVRGRQPAVHARTFRG